MPKNSPTRPHWSINHILITLIMGSAVVVMFYAAVHYISATLQ